MVMGRDETLLDHPHGYHRDTISDTPGCTPQKHWHRIQACVPSTLLLCLASSFSSCFSPSSVTSVLSLSLSPEQNISHYSSRATVVQEVEKSFSNQKVASSIPCRSVLEQDTEPLIAPDVQCAISVNVKCVYIVVSRFG